MESLDDDVASCSRMVSVPLRGLGSWKDKARALELTHLYVSVPLRGLGSWKEWGSHNTGRLPNVSVPLRGLGSWKGGREWIYRPNIYRFSPLAGIRFVES